MIMIYVVTNKGALVSFYKHKEIKGGKIKLKYLKSKKWGKPQISVKEFDGWEINPVAGAPLHEIIKWAVRKYLATKDFMWIMGVGLVTDEYIKKMMEG